MIVISHYMKLQVNIVVHGAALLQVIWNVLREAYFFSDLSNSDGIFK